MNFFFENDEKKNFFFILTFLAGRKTYIQPARNARNALKRAKLQCEFLSQELVATETRIVYMSNAIIRRDQTLRFIAILGCIRNSRPVAINHVGFLVRA